MSALTVVGGEVNDARASRVLVTGGTGFVGSHLVERLLVDGYAVTRGVRDLWRSRWLEDLQVNIVEDDCTRPDCLAAAVQGVTVVFHCA